jgi:prolyl-tRNA editing enzyme YbaK/EbsC (Cys-tRNA(Pro) deacylase)
MTWPEPVERVAGVLRAAAAEARLEEFPDGTPTAADAADAVGCDLSAIVKSLLFVCDGRPVLVLVPGDRRADTAKVAAAVGARRVRVGLPDEVERATGFEPGAVAPFPLRAVEQVLIDRSLLLAELLWIGAGSPRHLAALPPAELVRLSHGRTVDLVEGV